MARNMRFWKTVTFEGTTYRPGQVASFDDGDAATLEAAGDAIDAGGQGVTAAPTRTSDPLGTLDAELDDLTVAWTAIALSGAWAISAGRTPQHSKDVTTRVSLRGAATTGAAGALGTLPAGSRPAVDMEFPVIGAAGDKVTVTAAGAITTNVVGSTPAVCVLDGISFRAA